MLDRETTIYIYLFIYRMQEIWEARAHSSLDLVAIRYPLSIYDRCFYLLVVCVLPTSQRPDLPMQSCSTTFLGSSIDSDVIQRCCKESQIEHIQWCILPGGLPSQIRRTPSVRTSDLCRVTECVGRKDLKRQSIAYLCVLFPFQWFFL